MNKNYAKGYRFERRVMKALENIGFRPFRQGKSAFPDIIAIKKGLTILVECKNVRKFNKEKPFLTLMDENERDLALSFINELNIPFILAYNLDRKIHWLDVGGFEIFKTLDL